MNTGAEAVETAIKCARRWGHCIKGIPDGEQRILVARGNFHGRTSTIIGFSSEEERELFLLLLGVQSVGPKVALAVLSGGTPRELIGAIAGGDAARFQAVPGIGKRTAERIIVELREKVGVLEDVPTAMGDITVRRADDPRTLARDGLVELGFSHEEAEHLLAGASGDTPEDLLQQALKAARA